MKTQGINFKSCQMFDINTACDLLFWIQICNVVNVMDKHNVSSVATKSQNVSSSGMLSGLVLHASLVYFPG